MTQGDQKFVGRIASVMVLDTPATPGLPAGTRVQLKDGAQQTGTVMPYAPEYSRGLFPVRLDYGVWQTCDASDVIVLALPKEAEQ